MKKRVAKRKRAGTAGLPELLDQLERTLPMLPDAAAPRPDGRDLTRRLGQIRAGLHARAVRRSPARRPRQPAAGSLPLFFWITGDPQDISSCEMSSGLRGCAAVR